MSWTVPDMHGRRVVITGGNSGIGLETARALAAHGATVTITARDAGRGAASVAMIRSETPAAKIDVRALDLADLASIHRCAQGLLADGGIDILINNAGVMALPSRHVTRDGFEMQFGTNHLGHFALTGLLLPALRMAAAARIVTISSLAHRRGQIHFDDLQLEHSYKAWRAYTQSKLANLMFALALQRRLERNGEPIISIAAHPGVAATNLAASGPMLGRHGIMPLLTRIIFNSIGQSARRGALPTLFAATADIPGGNYIGPDGLREMRGAPTDAWIAPQARDDDAAARLWQVSERLTGIAYLDQ